ncbi:MAG: diphthine--ammonia ligase [Candidatus Altiarchaeota archaeon]|nr:diphthine--ammonia ligase [Candidatus Altiarchaeota archaeon]
MCGIAGWFGKGNELKRAMQLMAHRGRDASNTKGVTGGFIGHLLHATVKHIEQPFVEGDSWMVANCEIYNWKSLAEKYRVSARNDAELVFKLLLKKGTGVIDEFRGPYAIAFHHEKTYLFRDKQGVFPLFYSDDGFASERGALPNLRELHPRHTLVNGELIYRGGFEKKIKQKSLDKALRESVKIRAHEDTTLFLSGIDSALIGYYLKDEGFDFQTIAVGLFGSADLRRAKSLADSIDLNLKKTIPTPKMVLDAVPTVSKLIQSSDPVKVEVGLVTYFASKASGKVGLSGLGADELFGGYARMHRSPEKESRWALYGVYERSTYRDNVIGLFNGTEIRLPYLDQEVIQASLSLEPESLTGKKALRDIAKNYIGELSKLPKKAAQYGSGFSSIIPRPKAQYLSKFVPKNRSLAALISGGKDSWYSAHVVSRLNYPIKCAIVMLPESDDSWMFQVDGVEQTPALLKQHKVPTIVQKTSGEKEVELKDLEKAIRKAVSKYRVEGVVSGAISSEYQRDRIEAIADRVGIASYAPLWGTNQEAYMRRLVKEGFRFKIVSVAADGLDKSWVGKEIDETNVEELIDLSKKYRFNSAGEGGEFETIVVSAPSF